MEDDRFVKCPLVDEMIENIDCIENADAVDGMLKMDKVPERFKKKKIGKQFARNVNGIIINTTGQKETGGIFIPILALRRRNSREVRT